MSLQSTTPTAQQSIPVRAVRQRRISRGLLGLAIALMAVFALATAGLVLGVAKAKPVLALARDVAIGQQITAADLRTVYINSDPGLAPIPATKQTSVVGRYALTNLTAGTLLTDRALAETALPGDGQQLVGISLKPGRVPPGLKPGAKVVLVATAPPQSGASGNPPPPLPEIPATVVVAIAVNNDTLISVAVADSDGPTAARLAAEGRLVVTLAGS